MVMKTTCDTRRRLLGAALVSLVLVFTSSGVLTAAVATVKAQDGMVAAANPLAAEAGLSMLRKGGNAVDAAAATSFALGVVEPQASGLGGEGIMVIHLEDPDRDVVIDGRSMAPLDVTPDATASANSRTARGAAVPGIVKAILAAHTKYGKLPLAEVLAPAITLARDGFPASRTLVTVLLDNYELLLKNPDLAAIYMPDGFPPAEGDIIKNPDLAWSLQQIAVHGSDALYKGAIAEKLVAFMAANNGLIGMDDLAAYEAVERTPARGTFRGYEVVSAGPPVAGTNVIANLNMWEQFNPQVFRNDDPLYIHIMAEIMKLTSVDYSAYVADPKFVSAPVAGITSDEYARERFTLLSLGRAIPPADIKAGAASEYDSGKLTYVQRVLGAAAPAEKPVAEPAPFSVTAFSDSFPGPEAAGWAVIDGQWQVSDGALTGSKGQIKTTQQFAADRIVELQLQTVTRLGNLNYNVGRLYPKYVDANNQIYAYLRTDSNVRFSVKANGSTDNYDAKTTLDPMQPHQIRMMFQGNKAEVWIDGQSVMVVENEKMGAMGGGIALWSQDSLAKYDDIKVFVNATKDAAQAAAPAAQAAKSAVADYKYTVLGEDFRTDLGGMTAVDGEWAPSSAGLVGTKGVAILRQDLAVDRHVLVRLKTLDSLSTATWNVGRVMGKYEDDMNRVYAYLRRDGQIRLTVILKGAGDNYDFPAPNVNPYDAHTYEFIFAGDNVQFLIDGKVYADVTNPKVSQLAGGIGFWSQDAKALYENLTVKQLVPGPDAGNTTHFSIVDQFGNAVSVTQTISDYMGIGMIVPGAGFPLNNEMKNFSSSGINKLEPGKRMRTTTAPTIILDKGDVRLVIGSPGSGRIITTVTEVIVNYLDFGMDLQAALDAPRFYSRNNVGFLEIEGVYPQETLDFLQAFGHQLNVYEGLNSYFGGVHAVAVDPATGAILGAADPRRDGAAVGD